MNCSCEDEDEVADRDADCRLGVVQHVDCEFNIYQSYISRV